MWRLRTRGLKASHAGLTHPSDGDGTEVPGRLLLQWHVTDRCNQRCAHCYAAPAESEDLDFAAMVRIRDQFVSMLEACDRRRGGDPTRGHVTLAGGEPFLRRDILDILELLAEGKRRLDIGILTNGTLIDTPMARRLGQLRPRFVQVSLDGSRAKHDRLRGEGNFDRVCSAIRLLDRHGVPTSVSFTVHRGNYRELDAVVRAARRVGARHVWSDRLIPLGRGSDLHASLLTPDETSEWIASMARHAVRSRLRFWSATRVMANRALQFQAGGGPPYACAAGRTLITVLANGEMVPCRRMPISVGNLLQSGMTSLYWNSPLLRRLRQHGAPDECRGCADAERCRGGLRCLAHAVCGEPSRADPGCARMASADRTR